MTAKKPKPMITYLGCPGHLIVASMCDFRLHTQIGEQFRVPTMGDYFPRSVAGGEGRKRETLGAGEDSFFETMVFRTRAAAAKDNDGCGCREVSDWGELECFRYATAKEAHEGHQRMVAKYVEEARK